MTAFQSIGVTVDGSVTGDIMSDEVTPVDTSLAIIKIAKNRNNVTNKRRPPTTAQF